MAVKNLVDWRRCPFCNGEIIRVRNCGQTEFECKRCRAIVIFKTTDADLATDKFNQRVNDRYDRQKVCDM